MVTGCKDCGKPTQPKKDGSGNYMRCFPCAEKAKAAWEARSHGQVASTPEMVQAEAQRQLTVDEAYGADKAHCDIDFRSYQQESFKDCVEDALVALKQIDPQVSGVDSDVLRVAEAFFAQRSSHLHFWKQPRPKAGQPIQKAYV